MKALVTGVTGFVGSHLAEFLLSRGDEVWGTVRRRSPRDNIAHLGDRIHLVEMDLQDYTAVLTALREVKPDCIYHLAAQSFVPTSWRAPAETFQTNVIGQINLFEAIRNHDMKPRIHVAGSSEEYGMVYPNEVPIKEENPLRPLSPYGVSKVAQDLSGYQYAHSYGMHIVRTRAFNHTGPRRGAGFVSSNFAQQLVQIERGKKPPVVEVGNLDAVRDFCDVRDVVRAYALAIEKGRPGEVYNIASGVGVKVRDLLDKFLKITGQKVEVRLDPARARPSDVPLLIGDATKFRNETGWKPEIPFDQTLRDLLDYWRSHI
ncbi:MAG: GDP-mannose 4,6-dehydratase [bacterium]